MGKFLQRACIIVMFFFLPQHVTAQRKMEKLGRGVVATRISSTKVLVSWRLLGTEPQDIGFNVYRSSNGATPVKLNLAVLTAGTNYVDNPPSLAVSNTYYVKPVVGEVEQALSAGYTLNANAEAKPFYKIKIKKTPNYRLVYTNVGDLDGDGEYDFVLHKTPIDGIGRELVEAYTRDGNLLWTIDLGPNSENRYNITPGSSTLDAGHGDNWTVYDINSDGKAEVILRTANGVKFSDGTVLADSNDGNQFISVVNGLTGKEISRTLVKNPYISRGQINGHMGIAYLDGIHPSVVWMGANRNVDLSFNEFINTWNWNGTTLVHNWLFDLTGKDLPTGHQIKIFDLDGDGKDEIMPQACAIDDNGTLMYNLKDQAIDHGDRFSVADLDPTRPGLETYGVQQGYSKFGIMWYYCDAKTGKLILSQSDPRNADMGRGMTGDFDPRFLGSEFYTFVNTFYNVSGATTSTKTFGSYPNQRMWWDGDLSSELLDGGKVLKWDYLNNTEVRLYTASSNTGTGAGALVPEVTPSFYGDIIGDWREEAVYESSDHEYLIVTETPFSTSTRLYTLPHNPGYRNDMSVKGYYQSNNPDYYLGNGMQQPPIPAIQLANEYWVGNTAVWDKATANWSNGDNSKTFADGDTIMFDIRGVNRDTIKLNIEASPARIWVMNPEGKDYVITGTGKLTGAMDLWKAKDGTFTLGGNHQYTGQTYVTEGQLNIDGSVKSKVIVKGMGTLGGSGKLLGGLAIDKGVNIEGGKISPGFGLTDATLGTLNVTGDLTLNENNFEFDVVPGSLQLNDSLVVSGNLTVSGNNKLIINFANNVFAPGTYTLIKSTGTLTASVINFTIQGAEGVSKELIIENNELKLRVVPARAAGKIVWNGSLSNSWDFDSKNFLLNLDQTAFVSKDTVTFNNTATQKLVVLNETVSPSSITFDSDTEYTLQGSGSITGSTGLLKNNSNNVNILSTNNSYTGKTIVNGGTLTVAKLGLKNEPSSIGAASADAGNIQLSNAVLVVKERSITDRILTISGTSSISIPDASSYAIFDADITGGGTLVKEGLGALFLVGSKSFTGPVVIRSGAVNLRSPIGNREALGTSNNITLENAALNLDNSTTSNPYDRTFWNLTVPEGKSATLTTDGRSQFAGALTGSGTLTLQIPFVRTDFEGDWSQFSGKIIVAANEENDFRLKNSFGYAKAAISLTNGRMYTISGASSTMTIGELSGTSNSRVSSDLSTANWIIGSKNTDATFSGTISKSSLTKIGTGTLTLDGNNTYTGNTAINAGRLLVNNAPGKRGIGTGSVTVSGAAILGGTGGIKGAVAINAAGILQPGSDGVGTLTDSASVTFASGAIAAMEISKSGTNSTFDVLKVIGGVTFAGKLVINKLGTTSFAAGDSFKLFNANAYTGDFESIEPKYPAPSLNWLFTPSTGTLSVVTGPTPPPQTITFPVIAPKSIDDADFSPDATASSGLPVSYTSSNLAVATIVNGKIHIVSAGLSTITATQDGNVDVFPAAPVSQVLTVSKETQNITFSALPQKMTTDADFSLSATSSSALPVTFTSSNTSVATVTNSLVHIVGIGSTVITASQQGDATYSAATPVQQTLVVVHDPSSVFTLPATNFRILATDESCSNSNNGKIKIEATAAFNYKVKVNGGAEHTLTSSAPLDISNLPAGNYEVSITVDGQSTYSFNSQVKISEPPALSVYSSVNTTDNTLYLSLSGSNFYQVELNGQSFKTNSNTLTLNLRKGKNQLIVRTEKECQGVFTKSLVLETKNLVYPNPFDESLFISLGGDFSEKAKISIYSFSGSEMYSKEHNAGPSAIELDLSSLLSGTYILKIKTQHSESVSKIVKK